MEQKIAILMADLSGYTALTEIHGASSAADLVDKYVEIVEKCLVGDSQLKERTGDEVMIVSSSPDLLLATADMIMKNTTRQEYFLQVHGGLHYGQVLIRNNSYFGSAINITARIAAKASPGTFLCSGDFINALADKTTIKFHSKQKHRFKNLSEEMEVAEVLNAQNRKLVIDPVCRMLIQDKASGIQHPEMKHSYFCSRTCLDIFNNNPDAYVATGGIN